MPRYFARCQASSIASTRTSRAGVRPRVLSKVTGSAAKPTTSAKRRRVQRDRRRRVELRRGRGDEREVDPRVVADRHRDVGCERPFESWCSPFLRDLPAASINALRVKCGGRVKAAPAASAASEALTRPSASTEFARRSGGHVLSRPAGVAPMSPASRKLKYRLLVTDDQVIEQRRCRARRRRRTTAA